MTCLGCEHITGHPHTLLTGRVVCVTCPRAAEERAMIERHTSNLLRMPDLQARRGYLGNVEAGAGGVVANAVKASFLKEWEALNPEQKADQP